MPTFDIDPTKLPEGADTTPVSVLRTDAIDAAGALILMARDYRKQAKSRKNGGERYASHRAWLRMCADQAEAAAARMQEAADNVHR